MDTTIRGRETCPLIESNEINNYVTHVLSLYITDVSTGTMDFQGDNYARVVKLKDLDLLIVFSEI